MLRFENSEDKFLGIIWGTGRTWRAWSVTMIMIMMN